MNNDNNYYQKYMKYKTKYNYFIQNNSEPVVEKSLYDRLGGIFAIAAVVDHFSDVIIVNSLVGTNSPNPELREWSLKQSDRLPGLKFMRTLWVCEATGGPCTFFATVPGACHMSLEAAHEKFHISPDEFDEVARLLKISLQHFNVPEKETNEVLAAFAAHKIEVTKGYFDKIGHPIDQNLICPVKHSIE